MFCLKSKPLVQACLLFSLAFIYAGSCLAQAGAATKPVTKPQQVIDISSRSLVLDDNQGISEYKGNVLFKQNTLVVKADTITLYHKDKKLVKALITGSPADVQHHPDNEPEVHSQAERMEYYVTENRLVLIGHAFVTQGNRHFSGEHIVYDTRQRTITAGSKPENINSAKNAENNQPKERVHVIIGPSVKEPEKIINE